MKKSSLEDYFRNLVSMDAQEKDGNIWFAASNRNGVYRVDKMTHKITEKYRFENEANSEFMLYHNMEIHGNRIFFAPHRAEKIAIYNMDDHTMEYISLRPVEEKYRESYFPTLKFASTFQDGAYVYMLGYTYPAIVKIHVESLEITYIDRWTDEIGKSISKYNPYGYFSMGSVKRGRKILLPIGCICGLLELDLDTGETKLIHSAVSMDGIGGIADDENGCIWIIGRGKTVNKVVRWDIQKNKYMEIEVPVDEKDCMVPFYEPLCYKNRVFLFPVYMNYAYEINVIGGKYKVSRILESVIKERDIASYLPMCTFSPRIINGQIRFTTGWDRMWHDYNPENGHIDDFCVIDDENIMECKEDAIRKSFDNSSKNIPVEGFCHLDDYINYIVSENKKAIITGEERVGEKIYFMTGDL